MSTIQDAQAQTPSQTSSLSFAQGFILGQISIVLLIGAFIKFFVFGEPSASSSSSSIFPSTTASTSPSSPSRTRTRGISFSATSSPLKPTPAPHRTLNSKPSVSSILRPLPPPTPYSILKKTYYNTSAHQPESLDWFNVLVAQTIAQLRADALADGAVLGSLSALLNGERKPAWLGEVRITEVSLGEEFPIFSNCRVWPVEDEGGGGGGGRLQARMDVDLSDALTLGIETTMVLNYPRPRIAVLPIALTVSVVRFSGTLRVSFVPASSTGKEEEEEGQRQGQPFMDSAADARAGAGMSAQQPFSGPGRPLQPPFAPARNFHAGSSPTATATLASSDAEKPKRTPTTLALSFSPSYTLSLSTRSLLGSRSRLQDIPKIAQIIEAQLRTWFEERCVAPRTQRIMVPSLWPRMKNVVDEEKGKSNNKGEAIGANGGPKERDLREEARMELMAEEEARRRATAKEGEGMRWRGFTGLGSGMRAAMVDGSGPPLPRTPEERRGEGGGASEFGGDREWDLEMPGPMPGMLVS